MLARIIVLLLLPVFTAAQLTPRNLLQKNCPSARLKQVLVSQTAFHPFPKTTDEWKSILPDSMLQQLILNGEAALKENFPNVPASVALDFLRNGNRTRYENITFGKRDRLWNLVLAESIEGRKRFTDAILDGIWSICEESFWGTSAHLFIQKKGSGLPDVEDPVVDLFAAETAATLAMADYFIGPELDSISPLVRRRIYYEVNRRVLVPLQTARYEWMGKGDKNAKLNNWTPWIMSNYLTAALLLEKNAAKRMQYVSKAMQLTDQYINGIGEDGGIEEGPHYWSFGTACVLDVLDLLYSASNSRINIYHQPIIRNMGAYIYRTHISGDYFVNVADTRPEVYPEAVMTWRFGQMTDDKDLQSFGAWLYHRRKNRINPTFHRSRSLFDMIHLRDVISEKEIYHEGSGDWLPGVQLMTARLSNGLFVAAHGGHNGESHNHNDVGDFIIYADGEPVIIDAGPGTYTARTFSKDRYTLWFNTSAYHNLPTINGQQQGEGAGYSATKVAYQKDNQQSVLSMGLEKTYPADAGLNGWRRTITAGPSAITVSDTFAVNKLLTSLTQSFMTVCDVDINQPGMIIFTTAKGTKISLQYDSRWEVKKEMMELKIEEEQGLKVSWKGRGIIRVLLILKSPAASGQFQYIISKAG